MLGRHATHCFCLLFELLGSHAVQLMCWSRLASSFSWRHAPPAGCHCWALQYVFRRHILDLFCIHGHKLCWIAPHFFHLGRSRLNFSIGHVPKLRVYFPDVIRGHGLHHTSLSTKLVWRHLCNLISLSFHGLVSFLSLLFLGVFLLNELFVILCNSKILLKGDFWFHGTHISA